MKAFRAKLPVLPRRFPKIPEDPRNAKKTKHRHTVLLIYGILALVLQMSSSREATREMSRPMFWENLKRFFPELEDVPHHDTLKRFLWQIEVDQIKNTHIELIRQWIRKKKFLRYLLENCYPVAVDGTQKLSRDWLWNEECLQRTFDNAETPHTQYYVYVLPANLAFRDGMSIPLMSEHLWLSGKPLNRWNLHERCNLGARSRWTMETEFLVEKHHGYQYEHCLVLIT